MSSSQKKTSGGSGRFRHVYYISKNNNSNNQAFYSLPSFWNITVNISFENVCLIFLLSDPVIGQAYTINSVGHE